MSGGPTTGWNPVDADANGVQVRFLLSPFGRYGRSGPTPASNTGHVSAWRFDSSTFREVLNG